MSNCVSPSSAAAKEFATRSNASKSPHCSTSDAADDDGVTDVAPAPPEPPYQFSNGKCSDYHPNKASRMLFSFHRISHIITKRQIELQSAI